MPSGQRKMPERERVKESDGANDEALNEGNHPQDVVLVHGVTEDRQGLRVIRSRNQLLEAGEVRPLKEGQAITSDVVRLHPRPGAPFLCDVETTYSPPSPPRKVGTEGKPQLKNKRPTTTGPAQVASQTYRENWDAIWAKRSLDKGSTELN